MGTFTSGSDVDIALFGNALTLGDQAKLADAISELSMPQRVDLLLHHRIKDRKLLDHIKLHGVEWLRRQSSTGEQQSAMAGEWNQGTLGDLVVLQRGHDLTESERRCGSVPIMGSAGQNGFHDTALASGPGVVVGRSGASFGKVHYCSQDYWPHNTVLYVTDFKGNDPQFVYYFLSTIDFSRYNSGSAQPSLNRNYIYAIPIAFPGLEEQRAIACILGALDDKIELNRRMNRTLEGLARAVFQSWFVDFDPVRVKAAGQAPPDLSPTSPPSSPTALRNRSSGESRRGGGFTRWNNSRRKSGVVQLHAVVRTFMLMTGLPWFGARTSMTSSFTGPGLREPRRRRRMSLGVLA